MVILFVRRRTLIRLTYSILVLSVLLSIYYVYYVQKIPIFHQGMVVDFDNMEKSIFTNKTYLEHCPLLKNAEADIDVNELFQTLDLKPQWMNALSFWDVTFEKRYKQLLRRSYRLPLKVILVPHSHNDPGWLETYIYYYNTQTSKILNNIVEKLDQHKNMTFLWSEVVFLKTWWENASAQKRRTMKQLIRSGKLEITTGGWVMADEATTHLYALVDQLIEGHQWLRTHLRVIPRYGWAVDVFGHGSTQVQLLAQSGISATIIQRIHYIWKHWLAAKQYADFIWKPRWKPAEKNSEILTHNQPFSLYTTRSCGPNEYVCAQFDFRQGEDYTNIEEGSVETLADQLIEQYAKTGSLSEHNVVLVPLGCDFCFKESKDWDLVYENYNKIIGYARNKGEKVDIQFGTVKTYFEEVIRRGASFPSLKGDFFVYADVFAGDAPSYWSGYFTTRPSFKILDRYLEGQLRSAEILYAMALYYSKRHDFERRELFKKDFNKIVEARRILALVQHHDTITGTSKSFVMKDHAMKVLGAIYDIGNVQRRSVRSNLFPDDFIIEVSGEFAWNPLENESKRSVFHIENGHVKKLIFFNPLAQRRVHCVRILTNNINTKVRFQIKKDDHLPAQISPVWQHFRYGTEIFISPEQFELAFVVDLPPLSLTTYELYSNETSLNTPVLYTNTNLSRRQFEFELRNLNGDDVQIENSNYILRFGGGDGLMKSIFDKNNRRSSKCVMRVAAYNSAEFVSGAYVFQPEIGITDVEKEVLKHYEPIIYVVVGELYRQLTVSYGSFFVNTVRIYNSNSYLSDAIHLENSVDFGSSENFRNTELFMRFLTDIENSDLPIVYTDSNGFHMEKRTCVEEAGIAGNYYPVTAMAYIEDGRKRLTLVTNHAHGVASLRTGELELMLDRRVIHDDSKGLSEGVVDNNKIVNEFWLLPEYFGSLRRHRHNYFEKDDEISRPSMFANHMSNSLNYPINLFALSESGNYRTVPTVKLFRGRFPCDVHVVNLRVQPRFKFARLFSKNAFLILHRQGYMCNLKSSYHCADIGFDDFSGFDGLNITQMVPMSLTGLLKRSRPISNFSQIDLSPMSIQTLNVTFL